VVYLMTILSVMGWSMALASFSREELIAAYALVMPRETAIRFADAAASDAPRLKLPSSNTAHLKPGVPGSVVQYTPLSTTQYTEDTLILLSLVSADLESRVFAYLTSRGELSSDWLLKRAAFRRAVAP